MRTKFLLLSFFLLFARGCDFYSTSLWFFDNPTGEQNLLYKIFGLGWAGLIISNAIVVAIIIYCFYYYTYKYKVEKVKERPIKLTDYISERYYNTKGHFYQVFYKIPTNKKTFLGHLGYVLIRVLIVGSFLATIHNLCQFYNVPFYNVFRNVVGRPLYVIFSLILGSLVFFQYRLWKKEFELAKTEFTPGDTSPGNI